MARWVRYGALVLALAGTVISSYLTLAHFNDHVALACPQSATINCIKVTTSAQSYFAHVPVAVWGLGYFVTQVILNLPFAWKIASLEMPRLALSLVGVGFILWLVYAEIVIIGAICLWCTSVHALAFILFLILLYGKLSYPSSYAET